MIQHHRQQCPAWFTPVMLPLLLFICTLLWTGESFTVTTTTSTKARTPYSLVIATTPTERRVTTELHDKKWSPRWNPRPDSEFYKSGGGDDNLFGGYIHSGSQAKGRRSKFIAIFGKNRTLSLQRLLVFLNIAFFVKQILSAIAYLPILNSALLKTNYPYGVLGPLDIIEQNLLGTPPVMIESRAVPTLGSWQKNRSYAQVLTVATSLGPFTMDFVNQRLLTRFQPHRYLTSGFLHASVIHLIFNMRYLWKLPRWVEDYGGTGNGMGGWVLYLSTYLSSIVAGGLVRDYFSVTGSSVSALCLGASGGICGLNGLMLAMLLKMGNKAASINMIKDMGFLFLFGSLMDGVSNTSHVGGFVWGLTMGWLFGPNFVQGYSKWRLSLDQNEPSLEYKKLMGGNTSPEKGNVPLRYAWGAALLAFVLRPELRSIPEFVWKGFCNPGKLSGMLISP
mmetsp:Transcript_12728/g.18503  ORF Transcript_12728/g.18503 Transcript_12728/m.18503 type:complete len:449 (+) Transcript_12728:146-1492(+)